MAALDSRRTPSTVKASKRAPFEAYWRKGPSLRSRVQSRPRGVLALLASVLISLFSRYRHGLLLSNALKVMGVIVPSAKASAYPVAREYVKPDGRFDWRVPVLREA